MLLARMSRLLMGPEGFLLVGGGASDNILDADRVEVGFRPEYADAKGFLPKSPESETLPEKAR